MKIIRLIFVLASALVVLGGCASAQISDQDMALERDSKRQTLDHNKIKMDNDCITADAAAKANAVASVDPNATSPAELSGLQYRVYQQEYERLKPECVKGKQGASTTGGRYNVTPEELARMPLAAQCEYASTPMLMLMANEARNIDHEAATAGSTSEYRREVLLDDCRRYARMIEEDREFFLEQKRIEARKEVRKYQIKRATPPFWSRFIGPRHSSYHSAVKVNVWYDKSGSRRYRGAPSSSRRSLWEDAGYNRHGRHKRNRLDTWKY